MPIYLWIWTYIYVNYLPSPWRAVREKRDDIIMIHCCVWNIIKYNSIYGLTISRVQINPLPLDIFESWKLLQIWIVKFNLWCFMLIWIFFVVKADIINVSYISNIECLDPMKYRICVSPWKHLKTYTSDIPEVKDKIHKRKCCKHSWTGIPWARRILTENCLCYRRVWPTSFLLMTTTVMQPV